MPKVAMPMAIQVRVDKDCPVIQREIKAASNGPAAKVVDGQPEEVPSPNQEGSLVALDGKSYCHEAAVQQEIESGHRDQGSQQFRHAN